jgi:hypothetical protein
LTSPDDDPGGKTWGEKWWERNGHSFNAKLDMDPDSPGMELLKRYVQRKLSAMKPSRRPVREAV